MSAVVASDEMESGVSSKGDGMKGGVATIPPGDVESNNGTAVSVKSSEKIAAVPLIKLFAYSDGIDKFLIFMGSIGGCAAGLLLPLFSLIFGNIVDAFNDFSATIEQRENKINENVWWFAIIGFGSLVAHFMKVAGFEISSARQIRRIREDYLALLLKQEVAYFDAKSPGEIASAIKSDTMIWGTGIGNKFGLILESYSTFISGFIVAFTRDWRLSLVLLSVMPFTGAIGAWMMKTVQAHTAKEQAQYAQAGGVAEAALASMRTVASFCGEARSSNNFNIMVSKAEADGINSSKANGVGLGLTMLVLFSSYGLGMWYGSVRVIEAMEDGCVGEDCSTGGSVLTVFFSIMNGSMALGAAAANMVAVASARSAAYKFSELCERKTRIDSSSEVGLRPTEVRGNIQFTDVNFRYPSRPDSIVFGGLNLNIESGTTVALVGPSGQGKSTVVSLLERFYDPDAGVVSLDGTDVSTLSITWLRQQMGLVNQEPALFAASIGENIRFGKKGATEADMIAAAKLANAHDFIVQFPRGYDTQVGDRGVQLSGGQKQRIAIARAIINDPAILLLDEATSALDSESERVVQEALDRLLAMKRRTTIVIAHRLSTIRGADKIFVINRGCVAESGSHDELMRDERSLYRSLVESQLTTAAAAAETGRGREGQGGAIGATPEAAHADSIVVGTGETSGSNVDGNRPLSLAPNDGGAAEIEGKVSVSKVPRDVMDRIWALNAPDRGYLVLALSAAVVMGCFQPGFAVILATMVDIFYQDKHQIEEDVKLWASLFVVLGVAVGLASAFSIYGFGVLGARLTRRLRCLSFDAMLRQDIGWFDMPTNSSGSLNTRLATEIVTIKKIMGEALGQAVQNSVMVVFSVVLAFAVGSWKMTLVAVALFPFMAAASVVQLKSYGGSNVQAEHAEHIAKSGHVANEALSCVRIVYAFGLRMNILKMFSDALAVPERTAIKKGVRSGLVTGVAFSLFVGTYAVTFWYGGYLVLHENLSFLKMMRSMMVIVMAAQGLGQNATFAGDHSQSRQAAVNLFKIIDRTPPVDSASTGGIKLDAIRGDISLTGVRFRYPSRPAVQIFSDLNLNVPAGTTVALVGPSGQGKSTVVSLIERFYDPEAGKVTLDGVNVKEINVNFLRSQVGLVSQEPVLFSASVEENIRYGKEGATKEEIIVAAKLANAHDFVSEFPDAYDTQVGDKGIQLSGGQKQRIAIARAIIKDPAILLLDEATSALDSESERVVQEALDRLLAMKRRTTIVIAHRLSTIRGADSIAVIGGGGVLEQGSHEELLALPSGHYKRLVDVKLKTSIA